MQEPTSACLVVVDVQVGFRGPHTASTYEQIPSLFPRYERILFSRFENRVESPVYQFKGWRGMMAGAPETELALDVSALEQPHFITRKSSFTALIPAALEWLCGQGVDQVDICGNDTDLCVTMTARDAMEHGIRPRILADYCCSTAGEPIHSNALLQLKRLVGPGNVVTANRGAVAAT
ncbi:MAG: isochorismatase family cysteine hydrolase [Puniceicoccales bacterium]